MLNSRFLDSSHLQDADGDATARRTLRRWIACGCQLIVVSVALGITGCEEKPRLHPPADLERAQQIRAVMEPDANQDKDADADSDDE